MSLCSSLVKIYTMYIYDIFISRYTLMEDEDDYSRICAEEQVQLDMMARFRLTHTTLVLNDVYREDKTEHGVSMCRHAVVFESLAPILGSVDSLETVKNGDKTVDAETRWGELHVLPDGTYELVLYFKHSDESSDDQSFGRPVSASTNGGSDDPFWDTPNFWQLPAPPNLGLDETPVQPTPNLGLDETPIQPTPANWGYFGDNLGVDEDEVY